MPHRRSDAASDAEFQQQGDGHRTVRRSDGPRPPGGVLVVTQRPLFEAAVPPRPQPLDSRYTLLQRLGSGGQSEVWQAHDGTRGVDVALKIVGPGPDAAAARAALEREYAITARLEHPGILQVFAPERSGELLLLPIELAIGGDLRRLRGAGYLDVVPVLLEIAATLAHAHERGVVHRDLKPGNILFDSRGRVRVADFGVSGTLDEGGNAPGSGLSPFTASPAQLRGEPPSVLDDIYGLGALAYELLSGHPPHYPNFDLAAVLAEPVPELVPTRQIPRPLHELVMRMLAKDPAARPQSMGEVIDELEQALNATLLFDPGARSAEPARRLHPAVRLVAPVPATIPARPPEAELDEAEAEQEDRRPEPLPQRAQQQHGTAARPTPTHPAPPPAAQTPRAPVRQSHGTPTAPGEPPKTGAGEPPSPRADAVAPPMRPVAPADPSTRTVPPPVSQPKASPARPAVPPTEDPWRDLRLEAVPRPHRLQPIRRSRVPLVLVALLVALAAGVFLIPDGQIAEMRSAWDRWSTPQETPSLPAAAQGSAPGQGGSAAAPAPPAAAPVMPVPRPVAQPPAAPESPAQRDALNRYARARNSLGRHLAALEARGAQTWGGEAFGRAQQQAAAADSARETGNVVAAQERVSDGERLAREVDGRAGSALAEQLDIGTRALGAGDADSAAQAFALARRIDPGNQRAQDGERRVHRLAGLVPLFTDGQSAENRRDWSRAAQDYSQALALDPGNAVARAGLERAHAGLGADAYSRAIGRGYAALGAGRLEEARETFEGAHRLRPAGQEAVEGSRQVGAALEARGRAEMRQHALALEAQERWPEAEQAWSDLLQSDPTLGYAQEGRHRSANRASLARGLQALIDHPDRLVAPPTRDEAARLLQQARATTPEGPQLRAQVARLEQLIPQFDHPVRLALVSDNATQVAIPGIGSFGTFARREIELKPGRYTVIGTRNGYHDVRRDFMVMPSQDSPTVSVTCSDPI